ncbi:MAG TPA: M24 family metallopeptidase [Gaiellaceae bacterium]|nr:M24 family metallopeptidase [Gaiellaceae bacterium]
MTNATAHPPHRRERLCEWMQAEDVTCTVLFGADHVTHLTGYARYFGGPSAVVLGAGGDCVLVVMQDEAPVARNAAAADEVIGFGERGFGIDLDPVAGLVSTVAALPAVAGAARVGVAAELPDAGGRLAALLDAQVVDAAEALRRIRLVKDRDELEKIGASYELCWLGQQAVADGAVPGAREIELFTAAQVAAQIASGAPIEFTCDLLSGPNTAEVCCPIHVAGTRAVEAGDVVIADVVVRSNGYWGDSAETHAVGSSDGGAEARALLLEVLEEARTMLVPGEKGSSIFEHVHTRVVEAFPGGELPHHAGHGLGLGAFEDPHLIPSDDSPLEPGMVIAVEPGVYFPGRYGARVENVFVVTPAGGIELRRFLADAQ